MKNIINNTEAFLLDFDGVVVESANIKTQAFYDVYLRYGEQIAEAARDYHIKNQGVSRYKKFVAIHHKYLNKICGNEEVEDMSQDFSKIVFQKVLKATLVNGVVDFFVQMRAKNVPIFLLSATPHEELFKICETRNLFQYFKNIYGSPYEKSEKGEEIIQYYNFNREKVVFIGDSVSDFKASQQIKVKFIGRVPEKETNPFDGLVKTIKDFEELILNDRT